MQFGWMIPTTDVTVTNVEVRITRYSYYADANYDLSVVLHDDADREFDWASAAEMGFCRASTRW